MIVENRRSYVVAAMTVAVAALLLSSCGGPGLPELSVDQGGLGVFNALPLFRWVSSVSANVKDAEYTLNDGATWTPVGPGISEFRPDAPLPAGSYTLSLRYRTWSGWSDSAAESFTVQEIFAYTPDDTYYDEHQWALPLIDMPLAWGVLDEIFPNRDEVVVAVIDTGYLDHPDLLANINTTDGYDFIADIPMANDGDGIDPDAHDAGDDVGDGYGNSWHGTSVAGNIAAVTDNATGIAGVAREKITIMPLRVLGKGGGYTYDIAQAVLYAAGLSNDSGTVPVTPAKIANLSLGGGELDPALELVFQQVIEAGLIVVAASGNASYDPEWEPVGYPASSEYTIAVGAIGQTSDVSYYSQMGAELDVVAPGGDLSLGPQTGVLLPSAYSDATYPTVPADYIYVFIQGTSFACPHVAGALALLVAIDPTLKLETARDLLRRSGSNMDEPLIPGLFEIGILNMASLIELRFGGRIATSIDRPIFNWAEGFSVTGPGATSAVAQVPESERDPHSLIVQMARSGEAALGALGGMSGVRSIQGRTELRLVRLESDIDLKAMREALLADPEIQSVYYNYRYHPL